jgi:hypothetical protein
MYFFRFPRNVKIVTRNSSVLRVSQIMVVLSQVRDQSLMNLLKLTILHHIPLHKVATQKGYMEKGSGRKKVSSHLTTVK